MAGPLTRTGIRWGAGAPRPTGSLSARDEERLYAP